MADFGAQLKHAREQRGISLRQIATATKISIAALEALERNDFSRLPGGIFSRAFIRAYALEVGLDPEQTVQDFLVEYEQNANRAEEFVAPEVTADDRAFLERQRRAAMWLRGILIAVVLAIAAAIIAWQLNAKTKSEARAEVTRASAGQTTPPARPASQEPPPSSPIASSANPPPAVVPSAVPQTGAPSATTPADPDNILVHLEAIGDCWVRATVDGHVDFQQVLHAGDSRDVAVGRDVSLQVGNAGALKWGVNGRSAKPLGAAGQTASVHVNRETLSKYLD